MAMKYFFAFRQDAAVKQFMDEIYYFWFVEKENVFVPRNIIFDTFYTFIYIVKNVIS